MKAEEIMIRSEIRQMLNEAGLNRESLREIVKTAIEEIIEKQVTQALQKYGGLDTLVNRELSDKTDRFIKDAVQTAVRDKFRYSTINISVDIPEPKKDT